MLTGLLLGLTVGFFNILLLNYKLNYLLEVSDDGTHTLTLSEHITFLNKAGVMNALRDIPEDSHIIIDFSRTEVIDPDVVNVIKEFTIRATTENIRIMWRGKDGAHEEKNLLEIDNE